MKNSDDPATHPVIGLRDSAERSARRSLVLLGGLVLIGLALLAVRGNDADRPASALVEPVSTAVGGMPSDSFRVLPAPPDAEEVGAITDDEFSAPATTPPAVVTPLGVPVEVIRRSGAGYLVRTPCGETAKISAGVPIERARVVIDPGHGGKWNTGALGPNGLVESDLNLKLSRAVLGELAQSGISAATTRTGDYAVRLSVRAAFADALRADALVSIHHNAPTWDRSDVPGTEVYVQSATARRSRSDSARLGGLLFEEITAALITFDNITWSRLRDAGVLRVLLPSGRDAYGIIRHPSVASVIVEYGYLSNPAEAELFATDRYIRVAAKATADAIDAYLHSDRPGTGFIDRPRVFDLHSHSSSPCTDPALE